MNKLDVVKLILGDKWNSHPSVSRSASAVHVAFAPANIALCKYWGKRNEALHLPVSDSISLCLDNYGTFTAVSILDPYGADIHKRIDKTDRTTRIVFKDKIVFNGTTLDNDDEFAVKVSNFLNLFRNDNNVNFHVDTSNDLPTAAGFDSSASGFAALTLALNGLLGWRLDRKELSIIARLGSGSATRSMYNGFVRWHMGTRLDGMDSYAEKLNYAWDGLAVGVSIEKYDVKAISSRTAMSHTMRTSEFYPMWADKVHKDIDMLIDAIATKDFHKFGSVIENNALSMHALMLSSKPAILYINEKTIKDIRQVHYLREKLNIPVYFTQDAGSSIKLIFNMQDSEIIKQHFDNLSVTQIF